MTIEDMASLLGKPVDHSAVQQRLGKNMPAPQHDDFYIFITKKEYDFDTVFILSKMTKHISKPDPEKFYVVAFHLYSASRIDFSGQRSGYAAYPCPLPKGIAFGDTRRRVDELLGKPLREGGGSYVKLLRATAPRWAKYSVNDLEIHVEFDDATRIQMITIGDC